MRGVCEGSGGYGCGLGEWCIRLQLRMRLQVQDRYNLPLRTKLARTYNNKGSDGDRIGTRTFVVAEPESTLTAVLEGQPYGSLTITSAATSCIERLLLALRHLLPEAVFSSRIKLDGYCSPTTVNKEARAVLMRLYHKNGKAVLLRRLLLHTTNHPRRRR